MFPAPSTLANGAWTLDVKMAISTLPVVLWSGGSNRPYAGNQRNATAVRRCGTADAPGAVGLDAWPSHSAPGRTSALCGVLATCPYCVETQQLAEAPVATEAHVRNRAGARLGPHPLGSDAETIGDVFGGQQPIHASLVARAAGSDAGFGINVRGLGNCGNSGVRISAAKPLAEKPRRVAVGTTTTGVSLGSSTGFSWR